MSDTESDTATPKDDYILDDVLFDYLRHRKTVQRFSWLKTSNSRNYVCLAPSVLVLVVIFQILLPPVELVIGSIHIDQCPANMKLVGAMMAMSVIELAALFLFLGAVCCIGFLDDDESPWIIISFVGSLVLVLAEVAALIACAVLVFGMRQCTEMEIQLHLSNNTFSGLDNGLTTLAETGNVTNSSSVEAISTGDCFVEDQAYASDAFYCNGTFYHFVFSEVIIKIIILLLIVPLSVKLLVVASEDDD